MIRLFEFWQLPGQPKKAVDQEARIDLGNGNFLEAEDVLEGHFHRLASTTVPVQVNANLTAAITVLAPSLTPLTELAEEVAHTMPQVQPAPQFRYHLHRALEQTHRQQAAQRILGTRPAAQAEGPAWGMLTVILLVAVTLLGVLAYAQKRPHKTASA
ncbi:hypothetical protein BH10CHL1_BH10CHL1_08280 [soil metagenome]